MSCIENDQLSCSTSTWRPPTKEEDEKEIIKLVKVYQRKKWYESKKYLLKKIITCACRLNYKEDLDK